MLFLPHANFGHLLENSSKFFLKPVIFVWGFQPYISVTINIFEATHLICSEQCSVCDISPVDVFVGYYLNWPLELALYTESDQHTAFYTECCTK